MALEQLGGMSGYERVSNDSDWLIREKTSSTLQRKHEILEIMG